MRAISLCFALFLIGVSLSWAQPWQWQRFAGDYYNPIGFPQPHEGDHFIVGDFDGNGNDDYLQLTPGGFIVATRDAEAFHWTVDSSTQSLGDGSLCAVDADSDGAKEIIVEGDPSHCWKVISTDPWVWEQRDDLAQNLIFSTGWSQIIYGDYDSDGLLNAVLMIGESVPEILLYERHGTTWTLDSILQTNNGLVSGIFDGDFDHDGDVDFAVAPLYTDVPPYWAFGENTPQGLVLHGSNSPENSTALIGPCGGDLDGDGRWEGLYFLPNAGGLSLVETAVAAPPQFIQSVSSRNLGAAPSLPLAAFRTDSGNVVASVHTYLWGAPFYTMGAFYLMVHTDQGWVSFENGFHEQQDAQFGRGNIADADGDGLTDILAAVVSHSAGNDTWYWYIWKNIGSTSADQFGNSGRIRVDNHLPNLPNCVADGPALGDITVMAAPSWQSSRIWIRLRRASCSMK